VQQRTLSTPRVLFPTRILLPQTKSSRSYSTVNDAPQPTDSGIAPLSHRRLISLSGPDTVKFLQGLITNNVHADRNESFFAAFLDSRGRILWDVFVWVYPALLAEEGTWSCYIEVDALEVEALRKHLKRHKLRSKVAIQLVPEEELCVWAAWGGAHQSVNSQAVIAELLDPRGDLSTLWRILAKPDSGLVGDKAETRDLQQYHLQRYKLGIAEGPQEIPRESALPMEVNIDLAQGIDFKKGCYVGQELTIRTKHTGVVRKRMLPVQLDCRDEISVVPIEPGTDIKQLDEGGAIKKGRAAGKIVAHIGGVGLALCRLEMMTPMKISAEGGSYREGMEFGISTGAGDQVVKVKPVLHEWFEERERTLWAKSKPKAAVNPAVD
jgi:folate-binding protein YgfZ